jgi:hypothetical protein
VECVFNIVPMEKKNTGRIQVCIDSCNLNKATPKVEHRVISFLDGNASYNQIFIAK